MARAQRDDGAAAEWTEPCEVHGDLRSDDAGRLARRRYRNRPGGSRERVSADRRSRAELVEERAWCHARDHAEVGDEMRLVVVAGRGGDVRPAGVIVLARGAQRVTEAREPGERLWAHAEGLTEHASEVSLAHVEVDGDGVHAGVGQPVGGVEDELRAGTSRTRQRESLVDRALQDGSRIGHVTCVGEPIGE